MTTYETYDLVLASYLVATDTARLTDIASRDDGRKLFRFDPVPPKELLIRFYSGEAVVSARRFAEVFASLKGTNFTLKEYA